MLQTPVLSRPTRSAVCFFNCFRQALDVYSLFVHYADYLKNAVHDKNIREMISILQPVGRDGHSTFRIGVNTPAENKNARESVILANAVRPLLTFACTDNCKANPRLRKHW
jgi:hypothetical protein